MLAVDDAQWLDPASARALGFALRRLDDRQLRLVTAVRTEGPAGGRTGAFAAVEASLDRQTVTRIEVGPLSVAAIHQMFARTLGSSFPRPVLVRIHRAAGGNPFYALEIGREVRHLGVPPPSQPLPIPGDHRDLALLRLRRLPRATRDALAVVAAMARPSAADLDLDALAPAERAGIVRVRPGRPGRVHPSAVRVGPVLLAARGGAAAGCTATSRNGPPARRNGPAIWRWRPTAPTRPPRPPWTRRPRPRRRAGRADVAVELKELACELDPAHDDRQPWSRRETRTRRAALLRRRPDRRAAGAGTVPGLAAPGEDRARVLLELGSVLWVQGESEQGLRTDVAGARRGGARASLRASIHSRIAAQSDDADIAVEHGEAALALLDEHEDPGPVLLRAAQPRPVQAVLGARGRSRGDREGHARCSATWPPGR